MLTNKWKDMKDFLTLNELSFSQNQMFLFKIIAKGITKKLH